MNKAEYYAVFSEMMRGSGSCAPWTHSSEDSKFGQFGWRCTNSESLYKPNTLIGNWSEERFDIAERRKRKPLPPAVSTGSGSGTPLISVLLLTFDFERKGSGA